MEDSSEVSLQKLIGEVSLLLRLRRARFPEEDEGLSEREILVLEFLKEHSLVGVSVVTDYFKLSPSVISSNLTRLAQKSLICKSSDPGDQRLRVLFVTPKGLKTLVDLKEKKAKVRAALMGAISATITSEERQVLEGVLRRVISCLKRNEQEGGGTGPP